MGDIADMMLDGILCQKCGALVDIDEPPGYPRDCDECLNPTMILVAETIKAKPQPPVAISMWMETVDPKTACKHGKGDCDICGTTDRRDVIHKTQGGKGIVGRLKDK
jgi:hypothetical protein